MTNWEKIYSINKMIMWEPQQSIVQFVNRFIKKRIGYKNYQVIRDFKKCLDLGCGNGSAVHFLAKNDFETYGIDISKDAINIGKDYLKKESLKAELKVASCDDLPFEEDFFDFITCFGVLDHVETSIAKKSIEEVSRILKPNGLFFITLCSISSSLFGKGKQTEKHTYVLEEGPEKGEIQHYFDLEEIQELLDGFDIKDIRHSLEHKYDGKLNRIETNGRWFITGELRNE